MYNFRITKKQLISIREYFKNINDFDFSTYMSGFICPIIVNRKEVLLKNKEKGSKRLIKKRNKLEFIFITNFNFITKKINAIHNSIINTFEIIRKTTLCGQTVKDSKVSLFDSYKELNK